MKRLFKSAQIYDAFNYKERYCEVFINPSLREIDIVKEEDANGALRGVLYGDGTLYIWPRMFFHDMINEQLNKDTQPVDVSQMRIAFEPSTGWFFDAKNKYSLDEIKALIIKNATRLNPGGLTSDKLFIFGTTDKQKLDGITLQELQEDIKVASRLRKITEAYDELRQ